MAAFTRGDVVLVPFPFSESSGDKVRPALVVTSTAFGASTDYVLALITSQNAPDPNIIELLDTDFDSGGVQLTSYIRPLYLFTAGEIRIRRRVGALTANKMLEVVQKITTAIT